MRSLLVSAVLIVQILGCASGPSTTSEPLSELVDRYFDEQPGDDIPGGLEGGGDCSIRRAEVDRLDAALELDTTTRSDALARHAPYGLAQGFESDRLLTHPHYLVTYDPTVREPGYAMYRLDRADLITAPREVCFREDPRLPESDRSVLADYREPVFDRGHLVPRADMNRDRDTLLQTFLLSNMMPQHDHFNRGIWATFEALVRAWADLKGSVLVVTGPLFDADGDGRPDEPDAIARVAPRGEVGIPSHFFKIVLHERPNGFIEAIAVVLPHTDDDVPQGLSTVEELELIARGLTSIDEIERLSGYDFFPALPARKQRAVERFVARELWR